MIYNHFMAIDLAELRVFIEDQGWSGFGIASISEVEAALKKHEGIFERWLGRGFQAEMDFLKKMQKDRYHPEEVLPEVRSIIVLQAWYGTKENGGIARFARGRDYHKVLKKKLIALSNWLKAQNPEISTYASVDSGPTVDRVLAEVAGLGFFGKNANLIDPSKGSFFFIASLMTSVELEVTQKRRMPNCGDCHKCAEACPTGAIVAPGVIDSRRCIAYLTIENKEGIPEVLRSKIGDRLFGCDTCQEVCPFNVGRAGRQEVKIEELKAENGVGNDINLHEILTIDNDATFEKRFAGTPLMRAKRRGLLRNACIVAGNSENNSILPVLEQLIQQDTNDAVLQESIEWAIKKINNSESPKVNPE
jgi:epoxyqueuosine reductase